MNSPNLQFRRHVLPNGDAAEAEHATREYLQNADRKADERATAFLAQPTGGEPAILAALEDHLPKVWIDLADAEAGVCALLRNASQYRHLSVPTWWYLLDPSLKEKANRILDRSPVALQAPSRISTVISLPETGPPVKREWATTLS